MRGADRDARARSRSSRRTTAQVLDELAALLDARRAAAAGAGLRGRRAVRPGAARPSSRRRIGAEDVQLYYQTAILGRRDLPLAPDPRTGFEMTLVRMLAFRPAGTAAAHRPGSGDAARVAGARAVARRRLRSCGQHRPGPIDPGAMGARGRRSRCHAARRGSSRATARCSSIAATRCGSALDRESGAYAARRWTSSCRRWRSYLGAPVKLEFVDGAPPVETPAQHGERRSAEALEAARRALEEDPAVREMKSRFGATLHPEIGAAHGTDEETLMRGGGNMMKQAMALQANMKKAQDEIAAMEVVGESRRRHGEGDDERQARGQARADRAAGRSPRTARCSRT